MAEIVLTNGKIVLVDEEDFIGLNKYRWYPNKGYAVAKINKKNVLMHRLILNLEGKIETDHINHNKLDNRKENIRFATRSQNAANQLKSRGTSKYKGVSWHKKRRKWQSGIKINYKAIYLGRHINEIEAARAYDKAAKRLFGEFALLNFA